MSLFLGLVVQSVANNVLGHKDVNTTKKHYAAMDDARRRQAATAVRLRESMPEHEE